MLETSGVTGTARRSLPWGTWKAGCTVLWLSVLASDAGAKEAANEGWTCVPAEGHVGRSDPAVLDLGIKQYGNPVRKEWSWKLWSDGVVELRARVIDARSPFAPRESNDGAPHETLRDDACSSNLRPAALKRFLRAVAKSGVCSKSIWPARWPELNPALLTYHLRFQSPQFGKCDAKLRFGRDPLRVMKLYRVKQAWSELEQSIGDLPRNVPKLPGPP
jgi:hypothetical protein